MQNTIIIPAGVIASDGFSEKTDLVDWAIVQYIAAIYDDPLIKKKLGFVEFSFRDFIREMPLAGLGSKSAVSKRIRRLREVGLIRTRRDESGKIYAKLTPSAEKIMSGR